jgi:hypothetical protein
MWACTSHCIFAETTGAGLDLTLHSGVGPLMWAWTTGGVISFSHGVYKPLHQYGFEVSRSIRGASCNPMFEIFTDGITFTYIKNGTV